MDAMRTGVGAIMLALASAATSGGREAAATQDRAERARTSIAERGPRLPATTIFEENLGQARDGARFLVRQRGFDAHVGEARISLAIPGARTVATIAFVGASERAEIAGTLATGGSSTYLRAAGSVTGARHFREAITRDLYAGVDLRWRGDDRGRLTYDLELAPGADPSVIDIALVGGDGVRIATDGSLRVTTPAGEFTHSAPVAYQVHGVRRSPVEAGFVLRSDGRVGFRVGAHDASRRLIIDPSIEFASAVGGSENDLGEALAVDAAGAAYVVGQTYSPDLGGGTISGDTDAFVIKLSPAGDAVEYAIYLGGSSRESALGVEVGAAGEAYVCGETSSLDFPFTDGLPPGAEQRRRPFLAKLSADGNTLLFAKPLGGAATGGSARDMVLDASGSVYVTGDGVSERFETSPGAFQTEPADGRDAFVAKLTPDGDEVYATFLAGDDDEFAFGIAVDDSGSAFVCGQTESLDFPASTLFDTQTGTRDEHDERAFVTKVAPDGSSLVYSTVIAMTDRDHAHGIAVDRDGAAHVCGDSAEDGTVISDQFDLSYSHAPFALRLSPDGGTMDYAVRLGVHWGHSHDIEMAPDGSTRIVGSGIDFRRGENSPDFYVFLANVAPDGTVAYMQRFGGERTGSADRLEVAPDGSTYVLTNASDIRDVPGVFDVPIGASAGLRADAMVVKLAPHDRALEMTRGRLVLADGPRSRAAFRARHGLGDLETAGAAFNPRGRRVVVTLRVGDNRDALTIPASSKRWRRAGGSGFRWSSPASAAPRWTLEFRGAEKLRVRIHGAGMPAEFNKVLSLDVAVDAARATDVRAFRRLPAGGGRRFKMRGAPDPFFGAEGPQIPRPVPNND